MAYEVLGNYDDRQLVDLMRRAMPALDRVSRAELHRYVVQVEGDVAENRFGPSTTPTQLRNRSGHLRSSVYSEVTGSGVADLEGAVGAHAAYGARHEFGSPGGRPPGATGRYAAIPLDAALTPAGVPRGPPRSYAEAFFIRSQIGNLLLVRARPGGGIEPLFAMIPWEQIGPTPGRLGIRDTMGERLPGFVRRFQERLTQALQNLADGR